MSSRAFAVALVGTCICTSTVASAPLPVLPRLPAGRIAAPLAGGVRVQITEPGRGRCQSGDPMPVARTELPELGRMPVGRVDPAAAVPIPNACALTPSTSPGQREVVRVRAPAVPPLPR